MSTILGVLLSTAVIAGLIALRILVTRSAVGQRLESRCAVSTCRTDDCLDSGSADPRAAGGDRNAESA